MGLQVERLIALGADVNKPSPDGHPLLIAAGEGRAKAAAALIEAKADVPANSTDSAPAVAQGNGIQEHVLRRLLR